MKTGNELVPKLGTTQVVCQKLSRPSEVKLPTVWAVGIDRKRIYSWRRLGIKVAELVNGKSGVPI